MGQLAGVEEHAVRHGERWYEGMVHHYYGLAAFTSGNVAEAQSRAERALQAFAASGDLWGIVNASETLGHSLAAVGDYDGAMDVYERALAAGVRDLQEEAVPLLYHYGLSRLRADDIGGRDEAVRRVRAARRARVVVPAVAQHDRRSAHCASPGRRAMRRLASTATLSRLVREAVAGGLDTRAVRVAMVVTLRELGHLAEEARRRRAREAFQEEGLVWARRVGEPRLLARSLDGLAGALSLGDRADEAARLLGAAEGTRAAVHARLPERERKDVVPASTRLRERLGDERFEEEFARGRSEYVSQVEKAFARTS